LCGCSVALQLFKRPGGGEFLSARFLRLATLLSSMLSRHLCSLSLLPFI
jgi:hypothetical protein